MAVLTGRSPKAVVPSCAPARCSTKSSHPRQRRRMPTSRTPTRPKAPTGRSCMSWRMTSRLTAVPARAYSIWRSRWITSRSLNCDKRSGGTSHASWFPSRRSWCFSHGSRSRLGLRPLRTVGHQLNAVQSGRIRRMPQRFADEIAPLVESINKLLDRQENLIRKARDRAGALAHGFKTPLTILAGEVRRLEMKGLGEEAERMQEQLVSIRTHVDREVARARTSGASVGCGAYTAVDETLARLLRLMQHMPRGERLTWQTQMPPGLGVDMDPHDFGEVWAIFSTMRGSGPKPASRSGRTSPREKSA